MCIYCRADPADLTLYRQVAHAVPEAVMKNEITLPQGFMCDQCNRYFGTKLEPQLIRHPSVAWAIQKARVPGKAGKVRSVVANLVRDDEPDSGFRVDIAPVRVRRTQEGRIEVTVIPILDPKFDLLRFRRALHLVAFNCLARQTGAAEVLQSRYNPVRAYVRRRPVSSEEVWPFAVLYDPAHGNEVDVELFAASDLGTIVRLGLYTHHFFVDLTNSGQLEAGTKAKGLAGAQFVSPTDDYPESAKTRAISRDERGSMKFTEKRLDISSGLPPSSDSP